MHSVAWLEPIHASYSKNKGVTINISLLAKHLAGFHWIRSHSSVFYSKTIFFFNTFVQIQSRGYCPEFYTLISVFLLGGSSYFARYYRFRSRSTQQTGLFDRNKEARVSDSVFLFSVYRREPIRLKEPRESCLVLEDFHHGLIQRKLDRASDQRQDQQPGSTDRSADFGQGFGQAWRAVARAAGIFFTFTTREKEGLALNLCQKTREVLGITKGDSFQKVSLKRER